MAGTIGKGEEVGSARNWVDKGRASWVKGWQRSGGHTPEDGGHTPEDGGRGALSPRRSSTLRV